MDCWWCAHPEKTLTLEWVETAHILNTLERCDGNRTQAARELGVSIRTLTNKVREYRAKGLDVTPPRYHPKLATTAD